MNKIKFVSLFFRLFFQCIFVSLLLIQIVGWINAPAQDRWFNVIPREYQNFVLDHFSINTKVAGFFISMIPTTMELLVLYFLIKLFSLFARHEIFSANNVRYIRNVGYTLLLEQIVNPLCTFLLGFVLTSDNPQGFRLARIVITDTNIEIVLTALIIILISWIMAEGCKLNDEQQLTI